MGQLRRITFGDAHSFTEAELMHHPTQELTAGARSIEQRQLEIRCFHRHDQTRYTTSGTQITPMLFRTRHGRPQMSAAMVEMGLDGGPSQMPLVLRGGEDRLDGGVHRRIR